MKIINFLIFAGLLFSSARCAIAALSIVTIMDTDKKETFGECLQNFKKYFTDKGISVTFTDFLLEKEDPKALIAKIGSEKRTLIAVFGKKSLSFATTDLPQNTPVVFGMVYSYDNAIRSNATGVTMNISYEKRLSIIKEMIPSTIRLGILYTNSGKPDLQGLPEACKQNNLQLVEKIITSENEFPAAIHDISQKIDCFLIVLDSTLYFSQTIKLLLLESMKSNIPVVGFNQFFTQSGCILSMECDYADLGLQIGKIAEKILGGQTPESIAVQPPNKIYTSINTLIANRIGKTIPAEAAKKASKVFP
jgi:putative ABC transport system substrate-binding protein